MVMTSAAGIVDVDLYLDCTTRSEAVIITIKLVHGH